MVNTAYTFCFSCHLTSQNRFGLHQLGLPVIVVTFPSFWPLELFILELGETQEIRMDRWMQSVLLVAYLYNK